MKVLGGEGGGLTVSRHEGTQADIETGRQARRLKSRPTDIREDRQVRRQTDRQSDKHTDRRQAYIQTSRQADRQMLRQEADK